MRLILRVLGTWLLATGVVLLVIDGTKSLAAREMVLTPLGDMWTGLNLASLEQVQVFLQSRFFATMLEQGFATLLTFPAFAVFAVPGIVLAIAGRTQTRQIGQYNEI